MMMMSYQGRLLTFTCFLLTGYVMKPRMSMQPMKNVRRFSTPQLENSVDQMQYTEKAAIRQSMTNLGVPDQRRVLDSLSYLRMTASTSSMVPTSTSAFTS